MTLVALAALPALGFGRYLYSVATVRKDTEL
jgi:hypothetical protein